MRVYRKVHPHFCNNPWSQSEWFRIYYSSDLFRLERLTSPLIFLFLIRFSTLEREGFVGLRLLTGTRLACTRSRNLLVTSSRFRYCDLYFSLARMRTPSSVILDFRRWQTMESCVEFRHSDMSGTQSNSTRDSVLFTCWPPGPDDLLVLYFNSRFKQSCMR